MPGRTYQRGTPHEPLSFKWRLTIVSLLLATSAALAAAILHFHHPSQEVTAWEIILAATGAITCFVAFLYDAALYGLALQMVVFGAVFVSEFSTASNLPGSLALAARSSMPIVVVATLSMAVPSIFSVLAKILTPLSLSSVSAIATLNYGVSYVHLWKSGTVTLFSTLTGGVGLAVLLLIWAWYHYRTHRHMNLTHRREMGIAVSISAALILSIQQMPLPPSHPSLGTVLPVLLGSTICALICVTMAATSDVWNAVGTNQFWMLCLDMAALSIYSVIPAVLLSWRLWSRFGTQIYDVLHRAAQSVPGETAANDEIRSLLFLLAVATCFGTFYTKSLCPLGCHLYGRVYCSGMHFTKAVAICMDWADGKALLSGFKRLKASCHFVVTRDQLKVDAGLLQEAVAAGHVVMPYTGERKAHAEYERIWGRSPEWAHGESYPSDVLACAKNDTKIALWSSYVRHSVHAEELAADLEATLGGNVICFEQVPNVVEIIEGITKAGYSVVPLTTVMKEYKMVLSVEQNE